MSNANASRIPNTAPRYQFNHLPGSNVTSMGPPSALPRTSKRRLATSSSTKPESSSSGKARPRVIASDSAIDTTQDMCTPRNRPNAFRYISSSSRGGHSGNRSARSTSTSAVDASVILAISEGRGMARGEIGIAAVDLKHPHLVLCQFSDTLLYTHTLTKINYFNPVEIIVPHTFCEGVKPNQLYQLIRDTYPLVNLTTVQRRHFNDAAGRQHIQTLCAPQYSAVYLQVHQKFYALTAAAAVLKYVEYIQCIVFVRESLKIEYHSSENTMIIDVGTATQLELVQPLVPSAGATCCLLGVLGPTYTIGGIRALRASILQPSCKKEFIENRLDAVQDLIENEDGLLSDLQDVIKKLSDVDKILLLCMESPNQNMDKLGEAQLNQMLLLKTTMDIVPQLVEALASANSGRLLKIKLDFENPNYKEIADRIRSIIQEDAHLEKGAMGSLQRCFAVKPEINGLLDVARRTYSELIDDIQKMVEQLAETYDLPLRLNQNVMKGFHIVLPLTPKNRRHFSVGDLPEIFIQVHNSGASVTMTTEELVVLDQQAKESLKEIQRMSNIVISGLLKELRPYMSSLYTLCENVAELDILLAFAHASTISSYIRPDFADYLDIRNSVHPLLDYNSQVMPVPNDIYASPEQNFTIITGPNMGGKSIYIKQIAVLQVMAQLGCFLPATNAVIRLCDRIFSRIGFNDSVELNASTYVFEMKEMQHILRSLTSSSLVIIDELCRGTCTEEGTSMAWAICEELIMSDAFTFFTTHFIYLTRLRDLYYNVINRHTAVAEETITDSEDGQKRLIYQHKVELGVTSIDRYGLALAAKTNLPEDTVKLAVELAELINQTRQPQEIRTPQKGDEELLYELNTELQLKFRRNELSNEQNKQYLRKFKTNYPNIIERFRIQSRSNNNGTDNSTVMNSKQIEISSEENMSTNKNIFEQKNYENITQTKKAPANYPSSNDQEKPNIVDANYMLVRSSGELLNTVMRMETNAKEDEYSQNELPNVILSNHERTHSSYDSQNKTEKSDEKDNLSEDYNMINNSDSGHETKSVQEINDAYFHSDDDSDIAEAATQILEEYSLLDDSRSVSSDVSLEDLMRETVEEINEEIASGVNIDNIVLTPPTDFQ
ncbi:mutS protein homolog 4 [Amyelois transitella]|uniref:mutS protein homolog 4 n=1 Tax=Amyelois transitella TaxID=680683 RepID=UPI00298F788E|nr:mutS protein homolog 4 [Amyelois transitella]